MPCSDYGKRGNTGAGSPPSNSGVGNALPASGIPVPRTVCSCGRVPWWWVVVIGIAAVILGTIVGRKRQS